MTTLSTDVIFSCILSKLPAKSLFRFKCVSKSFFAEISSNNFIKLHHLNALSSDANHLLILPSNQDRTLNIYDLDSPNTPPSVWHYPKPKLFAETTMNVVASCECYLLMGYNNYQDLILLNPTTRTYLELPTLEFELPYHEISSSKYGMCHCLDELNDYYKVVRFIEFGKRYDSIEDSYMRVFVYSTRTNLWKLIECEKTYYTIVSWDKANGILLQNKLLHFIFKDKRRNWFYNEDEVSKVRCFDIKDEQWTNDVVLPDYPSWVKPLYLGVLDENLCFLTRARNMNKFTCDLWVMKEYGVKESWVKLIKLGLSDDILKSMDEHYHPLAYRKGSRHELLCKQNSGTLLYWYDLENKQVNEAEFHGVRDSHDSLAYICKGSLLNFPGGQLIKDEDMYMYQLPY